MWRSQEIHSIWETAENGSRQSCPRAPGTHGRTASAEDDVAVRQGMACRGASPEELRIAFAALHAPGLGLRRIASRSSLAIGTGPSGVEESAAKGITESGIFV
jgi:hypothetical protein